MKRCPTCSTKNPDNASFCQCCGKSLEYVSGGADSISSAVGDIFNTAKGVLQEGMDKLAEPSKNSYPSQQYSTGYTPSAPVNQPGGGWSDAVHVQGSAAPGTTKRKYPFFQDENETTVAVLGESAIDADLGGTFQKSYAVLTDKRLYCKNDSGNFVSEISALETVGIEVKKNSFQWAFWVSVILSIITSIITLFAGLFELLLTEHGSALSLLWGLFFVANILALVYRAKGEADKMIISLFLGSLGSGFIGPIFAFLYIINRQKADAVPDMLFVSCRPNKFFFFSLPSYPQHEIDNFYKAAIQLGAVSNSNTRHAPSATAPKQTSYNPYANPYAYKRGGGAAGVLAAICAVLIIAGIGFFAYYSLTHCKTSGCDNQVYKDGYCSIHYARNAIDKSVGNVFDFFSD